MYSFEVIAKSNLQPGRISRLLGLNIYLSVIDDTNSE